MSRTSKRPEITLIVWCLACKIAARGGQTSVRVDLFDSFILKSTDSLLYCSSDSTLAARRRKTPNLWKMFKGFSHEPKQSDVTPRLISVGWSIYLNGISKMLPPPSLCFHSCQWGERRSHFFCSKLMLDNIRQREDYSLRPGQAHKGGSIPHEETRFHPKPGSETWVSNQDRRGLFAQNKWQKKR